MTGDSENKTPLLEIACFDPTSAIAAWKAGADRIEFCHGKDEGGITPSLESLRTVKQQVNIPVYLMIRPRGGDFVFSAQEFEQMKRDIDGFKPMVDGFVTGILHPDDSVDVERTVELVRRASPLPCTFHRAFDETDDLSEGLEAIISTGCRAVLSSGGKRNAKEGATVLAALIRQSRNRIQILPGGGVRAKNIHKLREVTGAAVFHSSGIPLGKTDVDTAEVGLMKAILARSRELEDGEELDQRGSRSSASQRSSGSESDVPAAMQMSPVSIGASAAGAEVHGSRGR